MTKSKLFDSNDNFVDIDDLTSQDSDDVFFDDSILEVSINGKKRFSRENPLRGKLGFHQSYKQENIDKNEEADDEYEVEAEDDDEVESMEDINLKIHGTRPHRQVERVDYALLHLKGKKENK